ncbi:MAG: PEP-CTERM sorting domain-containing protein [Pirellulales bacterium]
MMFDFRKLSPRVVALAAGIAAICLAQGVSGDVVTTGVVSPIPPSGGGTFTTQLTVGNGTNEESNDIWGVVDIDGGTLLQYGSVILGDNQGFFGELTVSGGTLGGPISQFNISGTGGTSNPVVQVGNEGTGYLNILDGARMTLTSSTADFAIGLDATGLGYVTVDNGMLTSPETIVVGQAGIGYLNVLNGSLVRTYSTSRSNYVSIGRNVGSIGAAVVDGAGSTLSSSSTVRVGESGIGTLTISHGGLVQAVLAATPITPPYPPMVGIGLNATSSGHIIVEDSRSMLQLRRDLTVGDLGQGTLTIRNGGTVQITDKTVASALVGTLGRIELDGGTFDGSTPLVGFGTTVDGYVGGDGEFRGSVRFNGPSSLQAGPGDHLRFQSAVSNQGAVTINGGEIQFNTTFTNDAAGGGFPTGRISLENGGTVRFGSTLVNNGVLANAHGVTNIHGVINNPGTIVVSRDTVATFHDIVTSSGTITVLPGGNALFLGDLIFTSAGAGAGTDDFGADSGGAAGGGGGTSLILGIDPENPGGASSHVDVSGVVSLSGTLVLSLETGLASLVGQTLNLITAGNVIGAFDSVVLPPVPNGLEIGLVYTPTGLMMNVNQIPDALPGDYNSDGGVDAADYSVWRDHLGSTTALPNDDTPGVGDDDYTRWRNHFGEVLLAGSGALAGATPEPSTAALFLSAVLAGAMIRRRIC